MADACSLARAELARYVSSLGKPGTAATAGSLIKAGMIGGISAPAKGVVGNVAWGGFKNLVQQPVEAGMDLLQSVARSAGTGFTVKPSEFREVVSTLDLGGAQAYGRGLKRGANTVREGVRAGRKAMKGLAPGTPFAERIAAFTDRLTTQLQADASKLNINTPTNTSKVANPAARAWMEGAFAAVEGVDRPFFEGSYDLSVYMQAKLSAVRQGLKGAARDAEIDRLVNRPTLEMEMRALDDAMYATFKDKPQIAIMIERGRRAVQEAADNADNSLPQRVGAGAAALAADVTVPFTGVPTSIVAKGASLSPLGLLSPNMVGTQAQRSRALANTAIGSSMIYTGMKLAESGILSGSPSNSSNQRIDDNATGRGSYALKVGDKWVDLRTLGPVAIPLFVGADLYAKMQKEPDANAADLTATGAASVGRAVTENSFAQGLKRGIDALGDENRGAAFAAGAVGSLVPAAVGQVSRAIDPKPREARTFRERVQARTPLSLLLPERLNPTGSPPDKTLAERLSPFSPLQVRQDRDTEVTKEIRRLGLAVGLPERKTSIDNQSVEIPRDAYERMVNRQGDRLFSAAERLIANPQYQTLTDEQKKLRMQRLINRERDAARKPIRGDLRRSLGLPQ